MSHGLVNQSSLISDIVKISRLDIASIYMLIKPVGIVRGTGQMV